MLERYALSALLFMAGCRAGATSEPPAQEPVPYVGGETSDFGNGEQPVCYVADTQPTSRAALSELGHPVDADLALLEGEREVPLKWAPPYGDEDAYLEPADTQLTIRTELDSTYLVTRRAPDPDSDVCPDVPQYRALITLSTRDAKLSGAFYARFDRSRFGVFADAPAELPLEAIARPDLRNFRGTLALPIDLERTHWSLMQVTLALAASGGGVRGAIQPLVVYTDMQFDELQGVPSAVFASDEDFSFLTHADEPGDGAITLDDYEGSRTPATFAASVRVTGIEPSVPVDLEIDAGGAKQTHDAVAPATTLELGRFEAGTVIRADAFNRHGAGSVRLEILVEDCFRDSDRCDAPDCAAHADYAIWPSLCAN